MTDRNHSDKGFITELDGLTASGIERVITGEDLAPEQKAAEQNDQKASELNPNFHESSLRPHKNNAPIVAPFEAEKTSDDSNLSKFARFQNHKAHSFIALPIRFYLAYVFIAACIHKLVSPESFAIDIATYQFLPLVFINPLAIILPYVELTTGIMLVLGAKARSAALMVCGMMVMFMIALSFALYNDLSISCGCFASNAAAASDPISGLTMLRDSAWLLLAVYVVVFDTNPIGIDRLLKRRKLKTT